MNNRTERLLREVYAEMHASIELGVDYDSDEYAAMRDGWLVKLDEAVAS